MLACMRLLKSVFIWRLAIQRCLNTWRGVFEPSVKVCTAEPSRKATESHVMAWVELAFPLVCSAKISARKDFFFYRKLSSRDYFYLWHIQKNISSCHVFLHIFCEYDLSNRFLDKNVAFIAPLQIFATLFEPNLIRNVAQLYVFSIMPHFYIFHMLNSSRAVQF